jgi:hypothetical protein
MLATRGIDSEGLERRLNSIALKSTFEPLEPLCDTDIEGFLQHDHDMIILTAVEEVHTLLLPYVVGIGKQYSRTWASCLSMCSPVSALCSADEA